MALCMFSQWRINLIIDRSWRTNKVATKVSKLNLLDFYVWSHLKNLVYEIQINNENTLEITIIDKCKDKIR